jgi:uncharacterized protein YbjT (DUF2867 family)
MKIVVVGASGFLGAKLVAALRSAGPEVVAASPRTGVNSVTGEGLAPALAGACVVVDVTNPPSLDGDLAMEFFQASGRNLVAAGRAAGVAHHVVVSIVGIDRLASGYFRAKVAQEELVRKSAIPHTIVRSTQFFEFIDTIVTNGTDGDTVRLPRAYLQPIAGDDAASALGDIALRTPLNRTVELGGPAAIELVELASELLSAREIPRKVLTDPRALYFGAPLDARSLIPSPDARLAQDTFADWLRRMIPRARPQARFAIKPY